MKKYKIYTADDEEPKCNCCDHICDDFACNKLCGPEHFWNGYERTELVKENEYDGSKSK